LTVVACPRADPVGVELADGWAGMGAVCPTEGLEVFYKLLGVSEPRNGGGRRRAVTHRARGHGTIA
jgi:hypothetical protein